MTLQALFRGGGNLDHQKTGGRGGISLGEICSGEFAPSLAEMQNMEVCRWRGRGSWRELEKAKGEGNTKGSRKEEGKGGLWRRWHGYHSWDWKDQAMGQSISKIKFVWYIQRFKEIPGRESGAWSQWFLSMMKSMERKHILSSVVYSFMEFIDSLKSIHEFSS